MKCNMPKEKNASTISMTAYDLNKSIISQMPVLEDLSICVETINEKMRNSENLMLLCKEISYYTIFYKDNFSSETLDKGNTVIECAQDVGKIISVDYMETTNTIEIWVRTFDNDNLCMVLFDCKPFMVGYDGE